MKGEIFVAPQRIDTKKRMVFLAGGITGCEDWQTPAAELLATELNIAVLNPRRPTMFDISESDISREQVAWEHEAMLMAQDKIFWFPKEGMCMITLFELGKELGRGSNCLIGVHPEYKREFDVRFQSELEGYPVVSDLTHLLESYIVFNR